MKTAVKEKPILFSGEMVRAILDGRKTQTRRVIANQPMWTTTPEVGNYNPTCIDRRGEEYLGKEVFGAWTEDDARSCPYGGPGTLLWVRETWLPLRDHHYHVNGNRDAMTRRQCKPVRNGAEYRADCDNGDAERCREELGYKWVPSIHMPRWASRITLEITDVRVQRVQDISGRDAAAEGCEPDWETFDDVTCCQEGWEEPEEFIEECEEECDWINFGTRLVHSGEHREWERDRLMYALRLAYKGLWDAINAKRGFGWDANPWVWAISFKVI